MDIGADGMKTGFTEESGYGIVGSVDDDVNDVPFAVRNLRLRRGGRKEIEQCNDQKIEYRGSTS